jgi:hypothetical protein
MVTFGHFDKLTIFINGKKFLDVTNVTTSSPIMNYDEAYNYAQGRIVTIGSNSPSRDKKNEKNI